MSSWRSHLAVALYLAATAYVLGRSPSGSDDYLLALAPLVALWAACATLLCTRLSDQLAPLALAFAMGGLGVALVALTGAATWDPSIYGALLLGAAPCLVRPSSANEERSATVVAPAAALALLLRAVAGPPTEALDASTVTAAVIGSLAACVALQAEPTSGFGPFVVSASRVPLRDTWTNLVLSTLPGLLAAGAATAALYPVGDAGPEVHWTAPAVASLVASLLLCRCTIVLRPMAVLLICACVRTVLAVAGHVGTLRIGDALLQPIALHMATWVSQTAAHDALSACIVLEEEEETSRQTRAVAMLRASLFDAALAAVVGALAIACVCLGRATDGSLLPSLLVGLALQKDG